MSKLLIAGLLLFTSPLMAQTDSPLTRSGAPQARRMHEASSASSTPVLLGAVQSFQATPTGAEIRTEHGLLQITALEPGIIHVRATTAAEFLQKMSYAVLPPGQSQVASVQAQSTESPEAIELATEALTLKVSRKDSTVSFATSDGTSIVAEALPVEWRGGEFTVSMQMPEDEHYFGLGDKAGPLDHRDQAFTMWNTDAYGWQESTDPLYKTLGFTLVLRKGASYGLLFDNTYRQHWDFGKTVANRWSFGADGGEVDYYVIYGPRPKQVVNKFTALVGRSPLPPLWSLGFQQSRYSYFPESRVREIVRTYREKKIPLDAIYLDIDYQRENRPFTVDPQRFPNFKGMVRDFLSQGVRTVLITDLHIKHEQGYAPYDTGHAIDGFIKNPDGSEFVGTVWPGDSVFPDFTRKTVRDWWGGLYKDFVDAGVAGFWNDMNEPSVFKVPSKTMRTDAVDRVEEPGFPSRETTQREIHNVLGMLNSEATYDGLRKLRPNERPFVLTRATYIGGQRYAASWTGDNSSTWNHMRISVPQIENLGVTGYPLVGADIGGYKGSPQPSLLTKWIELGSFNPIDRDHTEKGTADQEPWVHGPQHEAIRRRYIEERYRLLPYIYTSVEETSRTGLPLMRPLFLEYPEQEPLVTDGDWANSEFLFGHDLLVAPEPYEFVQDYRTILPNGNIWYEYWSGMQVPAGEIKIKPDLDVLPVFVRGGAIIARQPLVQSTAEKPNGPLELRVYPDRSCQGSLYLDDGISLDYANGKYYRQEFTCEAYEDALSVKLAAPEGSYQPWFSQFQTVIYGVKQRPATVMVNGQPQPGASYDGNAQTLTFTIPRVQQETIVRLECGSSGTCFAAARK